MFIFSLNNSSYGHLCLDRKVRISSAMCLKRRILLGFQLSFTLLFFQRLLKGDCFIVYNVCLFYKTVTWCVYAGLSAVSTRVWTVDKTCLERGGCDGSVLDLSIDEVWEDRDSDWQRGRLDKRQILQRHCRRETGYSRGGKKRGVCFLWKSGVEIQKQRVFYIKK